MFQKAIGEQNLERQLAKLASNPKVIRSIEQMEKDIRDGNRGDYESKDYYHNKQISKLFTKAKMNAWISIKTEPEVIELASIQSNKKRNRGQKTAQTSRIEPLLGIYK